MDGVYLKATEPLGGDSLLLTIQFPRVSGTQLIDLGRMKLEPRGDFDLGTPGLEIHRLKL